MKIKLIFLQLFICFGCTNMPVSESLNLSEKNYLTHLRIVENFVFTIENKNHFYGSTDKLNQSLIILEELTNIEVDEINTYDYELIPSMKNYKQYKKWFVKYHKTLYLEDGSLRSAKN